MYKVAMRAFNINISTVMEGGSKEELDKIPIFRYKAHTVEQSPEQEQQGCTVPTPVEGETTKRSKSNFIRRWMKHRHGVTEQEQSSHIEAITIPRSEDAICSICLSEYENDDLLCKLWCGHIYHRDCVKEWLSLNATCPLCKRDFRGKDFNHENRDEEEY
ncbi:hypothetical protein RMATCC62417_12668 [Rhizopus microsporus]|nr:hypothetical protein RMATCC62417_12668 [Rhizopus microsporus]